MFPICSLWIFRFRLRFIPLPLYKSLILLTSKSRKPYSFSISAHSKKECLPNKQTFYLFGNPPRGVESLFLALYSECTYSRLRGPYRVLKVKPRSKTWKALLTVHLLSPNKNMLKIFGSQKNVKFLWKLKNGIGEKIEENHSK